MSILAELASRGYRLLPLPLRQKYPPPTGWPTHSEPYVIPAGSNVAIGVLGDVAILITNDAAATAWATEEFGIPNVRSVRGAHWYFRARPGQANEGNKLTAVGLLELHVRNKYALIPPSIHPSGAEYRWGRPLPSVAELPEAPDLRDLWHPSGTHHSKLLSMSAAAARAGKNAETILAELRTYRDAHLADALAHPESELRAMSESASAKFHLEQERPPAAASPELPVSEDLWNRDPGGLIVSANRAAFVESLQAAYHFAAFEDTEELLVFDGGFYRSNARQFIHRHIEQSFAEEGQTSRLNFRREVYEAVRARSHHHREEFNPPGFLAVRNGLLDVRDRTRPSFRAHDPSVLLTFGLPVDYIPTAECPGFLDFLSEAQPDPSVRDLLQEEAGYILAPGNWLKTAFFWVGESDTGKSTLQAVLRGVIGPKNVTAVSLQSLSDNRFASAGLSNKLANFFADLSSKIVRDTGTFKMLTGGTDEVAAEKKFQPAFSFVNPAKLFFSANEMPPVPAADDAFYRRWIITDFPNRVPIERQDPELATRLIGGEGQGILNWAIVGLARLSARGRFDPPPAAVDTGRMWRRLSSSLAWFVETQVIRRPRASVAKSDFYARYAQWCADHDVDPRAQRDVGAELPRLVPGAKEGFPKPGGKGTRSVRSWCGIALRDQGDEPTEATLEEYTMPSGGVEPVELVESGPAFVVGSTGSTGSTGEFGTGVAHRARALLDTSAAGRWEDDGGRVGEAP